MGRVELIIVKGEVADCIEVLKNMDTATASTHVRASGPSKPVEAAFTKGTEPTKKEQREELKESVGVAPKKKRKSSKKKSEPKQEEPKQEEPKQEEPKQEEPKQEEPKQETTDSDAMTEKEFMDKMRDLYVKYKDKNGPKAMMAVITEEGGYKSFVEVPQEKYSDVIKKCTYVLEQL